MVGRFPLLGLIDVNQRLRHEKTSLWRARGTQANGERDHCKRRRTLLEHKTTLCMLITHSFSSLSLSGVSVSISGRREQSQVTVQEKQR